MRVAEDAAPRSQAAPPSLARVAIAFLRRDFRVARSYRMALVLRLAGLVVTLASFRVAARFVAAHGTGARPPGGLLGFWVVGLALAQLFHATVSAWSNRVRQAQVEGTLEAVLSTAAPEGRVVLASGLYDVATGLLRVLACLVFGALFFGVDLGHADALGVAAIAVLALVAFVGLGMLAGALTMLLRRTDPVSALAWMAAVAVGGVFFPVEVLPGWLRLSANLVPVAPALEGLRAALFLGAGPGALLRPMAMLAGFCVVIWPLAGLVLAGALRRARADGSLILY